MNPLLISALQERVDKLLDSPPAAPAGSPEHTLYQNRVRQARMRLARAKGSHTADEWNAIVAETGGICVRCGYQHDLNVEKPCKAYVLPISAGGSNAIDNLMPLCRPCTRSKNQEGINWLAEWRRAKPS